MTKRKLRVEEQMARKTRGAEISANPQGGDPQSIRGDNDFADDLAGSGGW